jgi:HEAT repeat protein
MREGEGPALLAPADQVLIAAGGAPDGPLEDRAFNSDPEVRALAIRLLASNRTAAGDDVLLSALEDEAPEVVLAAAETLAALRLPQAADAITECVTTRPELKGPLALALAALGDPGSEELLWVCMEGADRATHDALVLAVAACGGARSVASLLRLLESPEPTTREEALTALGAIRQRAPHLVDVRAIPGRVVRDDLPQLLDSPEPRVRLAAVCLLRELAPEGARARLLSRIFDADPEVAGAALAALAAIAEGKESALLASLVDQPPETATRVLDRVESIEDAAAREPLEALLQSDEACVRERAAALSGRARMSALGPALLKLLKDGDGHVRAHAARALGLLHDASASKQLAGLLRDPYPDVREAALAALRTIAGQPLALAPPEPGQKPGVRATLIRACDFRQAPGLFEEAVGDADPEVRMAVLENLAERGAWSEEASVLLADEDARVRAHAVRARLRAAPPPSAAALAPLLRDPDAGVRQALALGLSAGSGEEALPLLLRLRRDPNAAVARCAVSALGRHGVPDSRSALLDSVGSGPLPVRRAAIEALARQGDPEALPRLRALARGGEEPLREPASAAVRRIERKRR